MQTKRTYNPVDPQAPVERATPGDPQAPVEGPTPGDPQAPVDRRIDLICESVRSWLDGEDGICVDSVERTVNEGLFPRHDVQHSLDQAGRTITRDVLKNWVDRVLQKGGKSGRDLKSQKVLCLHAGNLPVVGLQDVIATLMSGSIYYGKLSSSDPWLLDGLLRILRKRMPGQFGGWATRLENIDPAMAEKVLFAGSQASVDFIASRVHELKIAAKDAHFLNRTARMSMAWLRPEGSIQEKVPESRACKQLIEAMLRYEGRGCRSVAVIVSSSPLSEYVDCLLDAAGEFVRAHPPARSQNTGLHYWKSYLKAAGVDTYDLGGSIITEDSGYMGRENVICWVRGGREEVLGIARRFGPQIQSVYLNEEPDEDAIAGLFNPGNYGLSEEGCIRVESVTRAQSPPVDWRPDGIDVLDWLINGN